MKRRLGNRLAATLAAAALMTGLAACGDSAATDSTDDAAQSCATTEASGEFPRTVEHHKGKLDLGEAPQRIVALDPSLAEAVLALGRPLVGGVGTYGTQQDWPAYLGDSVRCTEEVGPLEQVALEDIVALEPDLIISASIRHEDLYDELSEIAPTLFVETTGPTWKDNLTKLGEALGVEEKAAADLKAYEDRAAAIGRAINEKAGNPEISVVRFMDGPTRLMGNTSFLGIILQDMGLARPKVQDFDDFMLEVGEEEIRKADGDHIFVSAYTGGEASQEKFERNPLWKKLGAVQHGHVHEVDDTTWMSSVSLQGADIVLDEIAEIFGVDPAK